LVSPVSGLRPDGTSTDTMSLIDSLINAIADACGSLISPEIPVPKIPSIIISN